MNNYSMISYERFTPEVIDLLQSEDEDTMSWMTRVISRNIPDFVEWEPMGEYLSITTKAKTDDDEPYSDETEDDPYDFELKPHIYKDEELYIDPKDIDFMTQDLQIQADEQSELNESLYRIIKLANIKK